MNHDPAESFGRTAIGLARNPLGIIALFIVLIYSLAALVTTFASSLSGNERLPLIWFLAVFPVLVLISFTWLVSERSSSLYAPYDFKNEENFVRMQMTAAASLAAATSKSEIPTPEAEIHKIVDTVRSASPSGFPGNEGWRNLILWVDDCPDNNIFERRAFEAVGLRFTLALSTNEALNLLKSNQFVAIISDMGRREGKKEGYVLLDAIRQQGDKTPFFIYAGSNLPEHRIETLEHNGQGTTNNPQELFRMVMKAVLERL